MVGFFVFNKRIFEYLEKDDILERKPFYQLSKDKELAAYKHHGFWQCMDTLRDKQRLETLWQKNGHLGKYGWNNRFL